MNQGLVKICSLGRPADARAAVAAGADLVGLIFAPARRQVTPEAAAAILAALRSGPGPAPRAVGVFVDEDPARINTLAARLALDLVQLSGDEPPATLAALDRPALKTLRLPPGTDRDAARRLAERYLAAPVPPVALIVEGWVRGAAGGTGHLADWDLAAALAREYPVILAGGLRPDNVAAAIRTVRPRGVDVSSGVEVPGAVGRKDPDRIRAFVAAARAAFAAERLPRVPGSGGEGLGRCDTAMTTDRSSGIEERP
ncbi:MAG: phosphoribosylanthranilate isomerase [Sphaerobacter sp.]|nr:phosphoribosylanthranilate isomerase [Sphaerobacter sp.]